MKKPYSRNNIEAINKSAQLIYETRNGQIVEFDDDEMPLDLHVGVIHVVDSNYGLRCMGAFEHPRKCEGKSIEPKGRAIATHVDGIPNTFVLGRYAMVCYADDTSLIGLLCHYEHVDNPIPKDWVSITAQIAAKFDEEYQGDVSILYVKQLTEILLLDDEFVYFN